MLWLIVKDSVSGIGLSLRLTLILCGDLEHTVASWLPSGHSVRTWRRLLEWQEPWHCSSRLAVAQVTFEEDLSFHLDKVSGLLSESRWCSWGLLLSCLIPGAFTWSGNAFCQLDLDLSQAHKRWGTSAGNYFEHLVLVFNAFLSRELRVITRQANPSSRVPV